MATIHEVINSAGVQQRLLGIFGQAEKERFASSVIQIANTPNLAGCKPETILTAALSGAALRLSIHPSLGEAYIVPYRSRETGLVAQFQIGYKGYIQLALRTGMYKQLTAISVTESEFMSWNPWTEQLELKQGSEDDQVKLYAASLELTTGFRKAIVMSAQDMEDHAMRYSKTYKNGGGVWKENFERMAHKTMLRRLLGTWGPRSIEIENAMKFDYAVRPTVETEDVVYVDNPEASNLLTPRELDRVKAKSSLEMLIANGTAKDLGRLHIDDVRAAGLEDQYNERMDILLAEQQSGDE